MAMNVVVLGSLGSDAVDALREVYGSEADIQYVEPEFVDNGEHGSGISVEQVRRLSTNAEVWVGEEWDVFDEDKPHRGTEEVSLYFTDLLPLVVAGVTFGFAQRDPLADDALQGLYQVRAGRAERNTGGSRRHPHLFELHG